MEGAAGRFSAAAPAVRPRNFRQRVFNRNVYTRISLAGRTDGTEFESDDIG